MSTYKSSSSVVGNVASNVIIGMIDRLNKIEDPIVRHNLFIEILRLVIEPGFNVMIGFLESELENYNEKLQSENSEETKRNIKNIEITLKNLNKISKDLSIQFDDLSKWIRQPIYSPDHPVGRRMMDSAKENFDSFQK